MKIRTGFVSNSSSSSFVVIATKEQIAKALEPLCDNGKQMIKEEILYGAEEETIGNAKVLVANGTISTEDFGSTVRDDDYYEQALEDWWAFSKNLKEAGGIVKED